MNGTLLDLANELLYPTPLSISPLFPMLILSLASQRHSPEVKSEVKDEYDYIVVGAGSAGATLAARLSEMPCVSVLLLEAGIPPPRISDVPAIARSLTDTPIDWKFITVPQKYTGAGLVNRQVPWPAGKTLGGSSTLNGMQYVRGNRRNYDEWAALGAEGWSYKDVFRYFLKMEDNVDFQFLRNGFHRRGGPLTASQPEDSTTKKVITSKAILNEGYDFVDSNAAEQIGFFDLQGTIRRGQRCSTAKAYLVPNENRTNLDIVAEAMVKKILIVNKTAVGVEFDLKGVPGTVKARREVILSAGATNSPQLLMLSGIGPMSELLKFDIPVIADLPVGLHFRDHPITILPYKVNSSLPTFDAELTSEENIKQYMDNRTGPLTSPVGLQFISFLSNFDFPDNIPDHQVYFFDSSTSYGLKQNLSPEMLLAFSTLANGSAIYCASQLLRTRSIGTVSLQSTDPYVPPLIDPNYLADFRDIQDVVEGLKVCQKIMDDPVMKEINARPAIKIPGCEKFLPDNDLYLRCHVRYLVFPTNHQIGTCKMGNPRDPNTVVDPQLRVKGIKGLRVVDASIMPTIPWGNTNIPTIMVAEKASDMIKSTISCISYWYQED